MATIKALKLLSLDPEDGLGPFELHAGSHVVGRSSGNDVVVKKNDVSRRHAQLVVTAEGVTVEDLGSANGTQLNGVKLREPAPLQDGDEVRFGDRKFRVELSFEPDEADAGIIADQLVEEEVIISPAEETAAWVPPASLSGAIEDIELQKAGAPPILSSVETEDVPQVEGIPTTAPPPKRRSGHRLLVSCLLILLVGAVAIVGLLFWQQHNQATPFALQPSKSPPGTAPPKAVEPTAAEALGEEPDIEADLALMTPADRLSFSRAVYYIRVGNVLGATRVLRRLSRKYQGNAAVETRLSRMEAKIDKQVNQLFADGREALEFGKYAEAREAFLGVMRLAPRNGKNSLAAKKELKKIEDLIARRRQY